MNKDEKFSELKYNPLIPDAQLEITFINSITERQLGFYKKKNSSTAQINATAEDELVRKPYKEKYCELPGIPRSTFLMEFSPDGTKVASTHGNHQINVTDVRTGKHIKTLTGHPRTPWCIAFHPTSNQIIASGCLGGQVRVWDLSGGSEVWTAETPSVIASIAFHPNDRLLVIATFNELFFWDWSKPEPFTHISTSSVKEKVRYVAFDKLGHKLITGITNSPQTRWERVNVPVSFPSSVPPEMRPQGFCTRRLPRRFAAPRFNWPGLNQQQQNVSGPPPTNQESQSSVPERERRIRSCYRELVHQYEVLVHRFWQIYRRPIMIDQGTDPMEIDSNAQQQQSTSQNTTRPSSPIPSTSGMQRKARKSNDSHSSKTRKRRIVYISSSSSNSSPESRGKTSGSTQTGGDKRKPERSSSSSDDEEDIPVSKNKNLYRPPRNFPSNTRYNNTPTTFSSVRQLKLKNSPLSPRRSLPDTTTTTTTEEKVKTSMFSPPKETSTTSGSSSSAGTSSQSQIPTNSTLKAIGSINHLISKSNIMLAKYREALRKLGMQNDSSTSSSSSSNEHTRGKTSGSTQTGDKRKPERSSSSSDDDEDINHLFNNAKTMLAKNLETLEKQGAQVGNLNLPDLVPSTDPQPGPSNKPSKGTNTNENEALPKRKRRMLRPNLLGNILFTSSDNSSTDNEPQVKMSCPRTKSEHDKDNDKDNENLKNDAANEHSYADKDNIPSTSGMNNIQETNEDNDKTATNSVVTEPTITVPPPPTTTTETNSLMDRQVQRLVVESLSVLEDPPPGTVSNLYQIPYRPPSPSPPQSDRRLCGACGLQLEARNPDSPNGGCARTSRICTQAHYPRTTTTTTNTTSFSSPLSPNASQITPPQERARRRFLSHRLSAFHPTRLLNRIARDRASLTSRESPIRSSNFAQDEVINFSERDGEEAAAASSSRTYTPMIGSIVQNLESRLYNVQNIRSILDESSRLMGTISDQRENIMSLSNSILRNIGSSLDDIPVNEETSSQAASQRAFQSFLDQPSYSVEEMLSPFSYSNINPINSDHTYPINPETSPNSRLSPLPLSLQLTIRHFHREARSLRQQVESMERIDRAMIEVAQLQMIRQMLDELHVHFGSNSTTTENRNGVSSVRQMMAGTRISDSTPYDSPSEDGNNNNNSPSTTNNNNNNTNNNNLESQPSTSGVTFNSDSSTSQNVSSTQSNRARSRKNYPRCLFLMHRQYRRTGNSSLNARRNAAKDRVLPRRNIYRRFLPSRTTNRGTVDLSNIRGRGSYNIFNPDTLPSMTRRLEYYLNKHCRNVGRSVSPPNASSSTRSDVGEHVMTLRLNNCRNRMNRLTGNFQNDNNHASVTADGTSRFAARQALSYTLDTITRFVEINPTTNICPSFRSQVWEVIELSLLLSELLLLQILESIPPQGMNLTPERDQLSSTMVLDQVYSRMIAGQSNQITRSLRRLHNCNMTVRQALRHSYNARRNAMIPPNNDNDRGDNRQGLIDGIHNCLRNIRRYRELSNHRPDEDSNFENLYRVINDLIGRYNSINDTNDAGPSSMEMINVEPLEPEDEGDDEPDPEPETRSRPTQPPPVTVEDANSSDDNSNNNINNNSNTSSTVRPSVRPTVFPSSRSQDDDTEEERNWRLPHYMNVPIVQVNDVPLPEIPQAPQHLWRGRSSRQRLTERLDEIRTGLLRPRFLHPLYSGAINPFAFEDNIEEAHREPVYDSDVIPTITPNHRIQVWEFSQGVIPNISNAQTNLVVNECKIHNDASVDYSSDGTFLVTLLPSGGYMNVTNRLGVYSLDWQTLGQCLYITNLDQNAVSVALSPTNRHLLVGLATRRVAIGPIDAWTMARIFLLDSKKPNIGSLASVRELEQARGSNFLSLNCIKWLPTPGQGLIFGTNTGHLRLLT